MLQGKWARTDEEIAEKKKPAPAYKAVAEGFPLFLKSCVEHLLPCHFLGKPSHLTKQLHLKKLH